MSYGRNPCWGEELIPRSGVLKDVSRYHAAPDWSDPDLCYLVLGEYSLLG